MQRSGPKLVTLTNFSYATVRSTARNADELQGRPWTETSFTVQPCCKGHRAAKPLQMLQKYKGCYLATYGEAKSDSGQRLP